MVTDKRHTHVPTVVNMFILCCLMNPSSTLAYVRFGGCIEDHVLKCKNHDFFLLGSAQCPLADKRHTCFHFCEYVHLVFFDEPPLVLWLTCALVAASKIMSSNVKIMIFFLGSAQCPLTDKRHTCFHFCEYVHLVFFDEPL